MPAVNDSLRAQGRLVEHAPRRSAGPRAAGGEPVGLEPRGELEHLGLLGRAQVVVPQEVPRHDGLLGRAACEAGAAGAAQELDERVDLLAGEDQRRREPQRVAGARR